MTNSRAKDTGTTRTHTHTHARARTHTHTHTYHCLLIPYVMRRLYDAPTTDNSHTYIGVCWDKTMSKWRAQITVGAKRVYLGTHINRAHAASLYDAASYLVWDRCGDVCVCLCVCVYQTCTQEFALACHNLAFTLVKARTYLAYAVLTPCVCVCVRASLCVCRTAELNNPDKYRNMTREQGAPCVRLFVSVFVFVCVCVSVRVCAPACRLGRTDRMCSAAIGHQGVCVCTYMCVCMQAKSWLAASSGRQWSRSSKMRW